VIVACSPARTRGSQVGDTLPGKRKPSYAEKGNQEKSEAAQAKEAGVSAAEKARFYPSRSRFALGSGRGLHFYACLL